MQIKVLQGVLEQQLQVAILDPLAGGQIGEIDQGPSSRGTAGIRTCCLRHCAVTGFSMKSWAASGP